MRDFVTELFEGLTELSTPESYFSFANKVTDLMLKWNMTSIFDSGCNICEWIKHAPFKENDIAYSGGDISSILVQRAKSNFPGVEISVHDCRYDPLPKVDLILSSDVMIHLNNTDKIKFLKNFCNSGSNYLLMTDSGTRFTGNPVNIDFNYTKNLSFKPVYWNLDPWNFPEPLDVIDEFDNDGRLRLWSRDQLTPIIEKL